MKATWVSQSIKHLTLTQLMNSQPLGSSPALGSVGATQSVEPASDSVSPSLSLCPPTLVLYLSLKNKY